MSRDFEYYWLRLVIYLVVSICIGAIYFDVGTGYNSILARRSCAAFVFGFLTFMSIGGFPSFVEDMKVFHRERLNGHQGVSAFVISNTFSALPFLLMIAFLSGFFRLPNDIPKPFWRYPMSYFSFHFWAVQGQYQNDLKGLLFENQISGLPKISGEYILENVFEINLNQSKWLDLLVLFCMIIIYRILFYFMIKIGEKISTWMRGYLTKRRMMDKRDLIVNSSMDLKNRTPFSNYITNLASSSSNR